MAWIVFCIGSYAATSILGCSFLISSHLCLNIPTNELLVYNACISTIINQITQKRKPKPNYPILQELSKRFSPRHFSNEQIPEITMDKIFEAARWVPSGYNSQPWFYYWTRSGSSVFNKLLMTLPDFNAWAKTAAVLIIACYIERGKEKENEFAIYDLGASVLALILQAQHLGYYARQMGIFDKKKVKRIIHTKKYEQPYVIIALGKLGDYTEASKGIVQRDLTSTPRKINIAKQI